MAGSQGLVRPVDDRWVAGVLAGLGHRFGLSPFLLRVLFVISIALPGPQVIFYLVMWVIMPSGK